MESKSKIGLLWTESQHFVIQPIFDFDDNTVEIENGLYDIMYRPALKSVEKEAKNSLATRNELKMGFHFRSKYVSSGEIENQLMRAANQQGQTAGALEVCP